MDLLGHVGITVGLGELPEATRDTETVGGLLLARFALVLVRRVRAFIRTGRITPG